MSKNKDFKKCNIMGVDIDEIDMNKLISYTIEKFEKLKGKYICFCNVHTVVLANEDANYRLAQNEAELNMPDGGPLVKLAQKRGCISTKRTTGPSYMEEILKISYKQGWKHYFYGSTEDTLKELKEKIKHEYPGVTIKTYSPPFRQLTEKEDLEIVMEINGFNPNFIWVGLGAPKQELWMHEHKGKFNGVMVGVGAGFDYFTNHIKRAPLWMQERNLEWIYRLLQDPIRLFRRYFISGIKFIIYINKTRGRTYNT